MRDPFNERFVSAGRRRLHLLGGMFEFDSDSRALLRLVDAAYAGLRPLRLAQPATSFRIELRLTEGGRYAVREPPPMRMQGGAGMICGGMDAANFAVVYPQARTALVAISRDLLRRFPYHARYEVLEFAVFTLASRSQGLMPLHAGCVSSEGSGMLLLGESGVGKSTLALQCMAEGLDFVAEDAVFVEPRSLLAAGIANFLHLRRDALRLLDRASSVRRVRRSPIIRRRSGVAKLEVDVRRKGYRPASAAPRIVGLVFVSRKKVAGAEVLVPLSAADGLNRLRKEQDYASSLPGWKTFERAISRVAAFELRRASDAGEGARALRGLLEWGRHKS